MTKKHFIAVAKEISAMVDRNAAAQAARIFMRVAQADNARFDADRFLAACHLDQLKG